MTPRFARLALALLAAAPLAACSNGTPEAGPAEENLGAEIDESKDNIVDLTNTAPAPAPVANTAASAPETTLAPPPPPGEQVQADADATGMTARVNREDDAAPAGSDTTQQQPADVSEKKE